VDAIDLSQIRTALDEREEGGTEHHGQLWVSVATSRAIAMAYRRAVVSRKRF
jgi:hypothetical protein